MLDKEMFSENENSLMNYTYEDFKELFGKVVLFSLL
jgi:hypothetical protein